MKILYENATTLVPSSCDTFIGLTKEGRRVYFCQWVGNKSTHGTAYTLCIKMFKEDVAFDPSHTDELLPETFAKACALALLGGSDV